MNLKPAHVPVVVQEHTLRVSAPFTQIIALKRNSLLLTVVGLFHVGPLGPRIGGRTHLGRAGAVFQLAHRARTLAHRRTHAVVARVAAADNDDVFALGADSRLAALEQRARLLGEIIDRVDHVARGEAFLEAFGANTACRTRARRHDNCIEFLGKPCSHRGIGRVGVQAKLDAKLGHELGAARDHRLLELHVGDTVHEKAARTVVALRHRDMGTAAREVPSGDQTCRPRTNHGDLRGIRGSRRESARPAVFPVPIGDGTLIVVNRHGLVVAA